MDWTLEKIPPKGHKEVAEFAENLFSIAETEKERLHKNDDFLANYALYRGKKPATVQATETPVNLYFSNIERTVANITARKPVGEVVDLDGFEDDAEQIISIAIQKWWKKSNQQEKIKATARTMEVYGITVEKPFWDKERFAPGIMLTDPFAFFPAPGNWADIAMEAPYICFAYLEFVSKVEKDYSVTDVLPEDAYELLGHVREECVTVPKMTKGNYSDALIPADKEKAVDSKLERCLVKEIWVRDSSTRTEKTVDYDEDGIEVPVTIKESIYPDEIRKITITRAKKDGAKDSYIVLDDSANPNINPALEPELASTTYPWSRLPCYTANSYKDLISPWGFAAAEQVGDLIVKINRIVSKLVNYVINVMAPPLIVQQHCGITREMIEESFSKGGRLVLMPTTPNARIEFMQIPNLPATFFQVLDLIVRFFDRIYATESADRGEAPRGVIAASAIHLLQERNQVLMQSKTSAIDNIAEERSRWAVGLWQNFGTKAEPVEVAGKMVPFVGVNYAGRQFSYVVETGSTMPKTSLDIEEMSVKLYELNAIDRQALLENLNFPNYKEIIERVGESQLDAALQVLIEAGMEEEDAIRLREYLMEPNQHSEKKSASAKTKTPKTPQGV